MDKKTFEELVFQGGIRLGDSPYDPTKLTIDQGTDAAPDDLFSSATYNKIKNHWVGGAATDPQNGMIQSIVAGSKLQHRSGGAWEEILQLTRSADVSPLFDHLGLGGAAIDVDAGIIFGELMTDVDNSEKYGINSYLQVRKLAAAMTSIAVGLSGIVILDSTNTQNWTSASLGLRAVQGYIQTEGGSTGTITGAASFVAYGNIVDAATITSLYGLYVFTPIVAGNKVINEYGIYIEDQNTGLTLNYAIYTNVGLVRFGDVVFINETLNAKMTMGLTINQGTNDDEILALKSEGDVAHGVTDIAETDTYGTMQKVIGNSGGLMITGIISAGTEAMRIFAIAAGDNTDKDADAEAPIMLASAKANGTAIQSCGANANLVIISDSGVAGNVRFIFDVEGDMFYDGAAPAPYDEYEDAIVCHDLANHLCDLKNPAKEGFKNFIRYNKDALIKMGVVSEGGFVSTKSLNMLLLGAISQLGQKIKLLESKKDN